MELLPLNGDYRKNVQVERLAVNPMQARIVMSWDRWKDIVALVNNCDGLVTTLEGAVGMLELVADCASHECEDCRFHAAKHRDQGRAILAKIQKPSKETQEERQAD